MAVNGLVATGHLGLLFLLAGLFLPRFTLFVAWLLGAYPVNPLPDLINFIGWLFVPRFLIAFYIYSDLGPANLWFWAYIAVGLAGLVGESGYAHRRIVRRTTTTGPDGRTTTTTVEEEEV
jgi:hypothetical protein